MKKILFIFVITFALFLGGTNFAHAAGLSLSISKSEVVENEFITATVLVNTNSTSINNAEGIISFPADLLSVESINLNGSIFSIWVEQPSYSNSNGTVSFNGGAPNPGYNGIAGTIMRIVFRAKNAGAVQLSFSSASVYANDGLGTNVLSTKTPAIFQISNSIKSPKIEQSAEEDLGGVPLAPIVISDTVPNPEVWYSTSEVALGWDIPSGVTAVQLLWNGKPFSLPTLTYTPPISGKKFTNVSDGVSYLHVRFKNINGWGKTAHRKVLIDTLPPRDITLEKDIDSEDIVKINIASFDVSSGVAKYSIAVDDKMLENNATPIKGFVNISLPRMTSGTHKVSVRAYDKAGNNAEKTFEIETPVLDAPVITKHLSAIQKGGKIEIEGKTYKGEMVKVYLVSSNGEEKSYNVQSDLNGEFSFVSENIERVGRVELYAVVANDVIHLSPSSERVHVLVERSSYVQKSLEVIDSIAISIPVVILSFLLLLTLYLFFHHFRVVHRNIRKDPRLARDLTHKVFDVIREDLKESMKILQKPSVKRALTIKEKKVVETLERDVDEAEEYFSKRMKSIQVKDKN
ncbi:MAG: hypothetical protein KBC17_02145 [Candidatus Pacebacteria bacterium]|nr:hypothetical protein [Candidatus Paceibacterota bacterium]